MRSLRRSVGRMLVTGTGILAAASFVQAQEQGPAAPEVDERLAQQEQRIQELLNRVEQLEAGAMGEAADAAADATGAPSAVESESSSVRPGDLIGDVRETHELMTRDELESDEFPASWPMFGTDMRMKLGGYIKTDFVADFDGTLDSTQFLMRTIPVQGTPEYGGDAYVDFFARETRFNLDIRRVVPGSVPLRGFIEGDFFSPGNNFRLRHAYITAGNFIIGQTWTTMSFLQAMPYMIDFAAGDALFGGRAAQLKYQKPLNDRWKLTVGLEELPFLGIQNANNLPGRATTQWPLLAVRADYQYSSGLMSMGASVGQLHWDGGSTGPSDSAMQVAFAVGGRQNLTESAYATWHLSYSEGAGENIMAFAGTAANAVLDASGNLETFPAFAAVLGFGYQWTPTLSSNASYAYGWLDTPETRDPLALKRGGIAHLNLIWRPNGNKHFSTGAEIMWGETRVQNDATGDATRFQLMAKFEF